MGGTLAIEPLDKRSLVRPLFVEAFELRLDEHEERGRLNAREVAAGWAPLLGRAALLVFGAPPGACRCDEDE